MNSLITLLFSIILLLAGFSQIQIGLIKPIELLSILLLALLLLNGYFKVNLIYLFFIFSFTYAFLIGGFENFNTFITKVFVFSIIFTLIPYFKKLNEEVKENFLRIFHVSMFLSNFVAISILLFLPLYREYIVDISSVGIRLKGFFSQANGYAYVLILNIPISTYFLLKKKSIFNFVILLTAFAALILTQSRGAILGLILASCFISVFHLIRNKSLVNIKKMLLSAFFTMFVIIGIIFSVPQLLETKFGINLSRLNPVEKKDHERNLTDISISDAEDDRFYLIKAAFYTLLKNPLGLGFQEHHKVVGRTTGTYLIPHNYFISLFLYYGFFFGLIWNLIIMVMLMKGFRILVKNKLTPKDIFFYLNIVVLAVSLYYLTHSPEWFYFYVILAIYCSYFSYQNKSIPKELK